MLIKKYTSDWITKFKDLKDEIDKGLSGIEYRIEHVGSTSVPMLDAKDIIDIDIIYKHESEFEKIEEGKIKLLIRDILGCIRLKLAYQTQYSNEKLN